MPLVERKSYVFDSHSHWEVCARDGFPIQGDDLVVSAERATRSISVMAEDRQPAALAYDSSGRLFWLRSTGELMSFGEGRLTAECRLAPGPLPSTEPPSVYLALSRAYAWLAVGERLLTFERLHWQQLGEQAIGRILALTANGDGAWCLVDPAPDTRPTPEAGSCRKDDAPRWTHVGPSGSPDRPDVTLPCKRPILGGAFDRSGDRLLTLTEEGVRHDDPCASTDRPLAVDLRPHRCRFEPLRIAVDCRGVVHLLGVDPVKPHKRFLWSFAGDGSRIGDRELRSDTSSIASFDAIELAGAAGVVQLVDPSGAATAVHGSEARHAVLITPTLVSPRNQGASWHRLRLTADLPLGTSLRLRFAPSDDEALAKRVAEISARPGQSPTDRLQAIEGLLPWKPECNTTIASADDPLGRRLFEVPLDGIEGTYLWIALHLHVPPTSQAAALRALEVRYPARSSIEHLPAIYRADPERAAALRRFLAVFETIFEDLEDQIDGLPARLAADGITDHAWLDFLLRWIGLPLPADVPLAQKRAFLLQVPDLLHRRGTPEALEDALRAVTGRDVVVADRAAEPMPWIVADDGAELGKGTLLIRKRRRDFRLGVRARLGKERLGSPDSPAAADVVERIRTLQIEIDAALAEDEAAFQAIDALLEHFLPAACRYELTLRPLAGRGPRRLGRDARFVEDHGDEIGREATLGCLPLPRQTAPRLRLDHHAPLDGRHRLL